MYYVTGDTHGSFGRFVDYPKGSKFIILGDAGINYYGGMKDWSLKHKLSKKGYIFYLVRGNHEERPENIKTCHKVFDDEIKNEVYIEDEFPFIKYLIDGNTYYFDNYKCLVVGGAYSIDKEYRLMNNWPWFEGEQLTPKELHTIIESNKGDNFDFVFTHTCPISWEPTDMFLNFVDQSTVDKTMENGLQHLSEVIDYKYWLFGHYHNDRLERPHVEMYFHDISDLEGIDKFWKEVDSGDYSMFWKMEKSPNYPQWG